MFQTFPDVAQKNLHQLIAIALEEDGPDATSQAVFHPEDTLTASLVAKADAVIAGLPLVDLVLGATGAPYHLTLFARDGERVASGTELARIHGQAQGILKAERVLLNFLCHLCGVATLTRAFVDAVAGTLDALVDEAEWTARENAQPTAEQLAPLPAIDAPSRPWPRSRHAAPAFTVDYSVPVPPQDGPRP